MSDPNLSDPEAFSLRIPACDSCRARKIKCDRKAPCSSCKASQVVCRTTKRNPEKKQRILVSGRYEREIENVNGRLASLEKILQVLVSTNKHVAADTSPTVLAESLSTPRDSQVVETEVGFEGDSSFAAHSKLAVMGFESSLNSSPYSSSIQDVSAAVATLRGFLTKSPNTQDESSISGQESMNEIAHYPQLSNLLLPPMDIVLRLLRHVKVHGHRFLHECPMLTIHDLTGLCQSIYFPAEPYTIATFITVHTALYYLFRDLPLSDMEVLNMPRSEAQSMVDICVKNAEMACRNLRLVMDPTYENLQALMMGSVFAMELSRPAFGWTLISAACRMCQDAGYHRLPPYSAAPDQDTTKKRVLFWFVYTTDRAMALNFGRAPNMQRYDISVDRPKVPEEMESAWGTMYYFWIDYADIQGDAYEQLYCARAQSEPLEIKIRHARSLAERLHKLRKNFDIDTSNAPFAEEFRDALLSMDIVILSTLTLVYRVIPPSASPKNQAHHPLKPCEEALSTARQALATSNAAWDILQHRTGEDWRLFIHWTLLWCPFVPYLVVFGNSVVERNRDDLELLEKVVTTLQGAQPRSPGVDKLERACKIFSQIARIYLDQTEAANQQQLHQQQKSHQHFEPIHALSATANSMSSVAGTISTTTQTIQQQDVQIMDAILPDLPLSQQAWDGMFDEWDLGLGAENAREMSSYFEHLTGIGSITNILGVAQQEPFG